MQSLQQKRGLAALGQIGTPNAAPFHKNDVAKLPGIIRSSGLILALAFACEKNNNKQDKRPGMKKVGDAIAEHLSTQISPLSGKTTATNLHTELCKDGTGFITLQRAQDESLAYLAHLKRYAHPKPENAAPENGNANEPPAEKPTS